MLLFAFAAALISALAAGFVLWRAARVEAQAPASPEAEVYARQLAELDEQKAQGLLDEDGWRAARAEAGRRLLGAASEPEPAGESRAGKHHRLIVAGVAVAAVGGACAIYLFVGSPGAQDQPFAARLAEWQMAAPNQLDAPRRAAVLASELKARPDDPETLQKLALAYAESQQFLESAGAFERLTRIRPNDAQAWAALGEVRMAANDGRLSPDAREAFDHALALDPRSVAALWWLGRADVLAGRTEPGIARWKIAAAALPPGDERRKEIETAIAAAEKGTFAQADAVQNAPPEQQAAMIRNMVEGLARKLQTERGTPQEWTMLIKAYGVLGQTAERERAVARARRLYAGDPEALKAIEAAAAPPAPTN
jgi:cytochrome c-type biogenesis protein CcmH